MERTISSLLELDDFGIELNSLLHQGDILCLNGILGAGKSTLTRIIGRERGVTETMLSPTYPLILEYETPLGPLFHLDMYRISHEDEALELGLDEIWTTKSLVIIEWPEKISSYIPKHAKQLWIEVLGPDTRHFRGDL